MAENFILTINAGSSSLKFALFCANFRLSRELAGKFDRIGLPKGKLTVTDRDKDKREECEFRARNHLACVSTLAELVKRKAEPTALLAVAHRIVHGGPRYREPRKVDAEMIKELRRIRSFDPDHLPAELALVNHFQRRYPRLPQVACFDTAFHRDLPPVASLLAIPRSYTKQGLQRYGFHGLSYSYLMAELERIAGRRVANGRVILAHLGNGASMAAVRNGRSVDTTMG